MIGTTIRGTSLFLAAVAAQVEDCEVRPGEPQGACDWICIPTPHGHVEVFDAEEVGEHGLVIRTYTLDDGHPTGHGRGGWISERATVEEAVQAIRRYVRETSDEGPRLVSLGPQDAPAHPDGVWDLGPAGRVDPFAGCDPFEDECERDREDGWAWVVVGLLLGQLTMVAILWLDQVIPFPAW